MNESARTEITDHAHHILVVDDDRRLRELLARFLSQHGYRVTTAASAAEAQAKSESLVFDALVLDVMMPGENGFDYARRVRAGSQVPILMLTAQANPEDRVNGLEIGADDYLAKPFRFAELTARVHALARRAGVARPSVLRHGDIELDPARRIATRAGRDLGLSPKEFGVLEALLAAEGAVVSAEELLERVWDANVDPLTNIVRMTVMKLRRKLGDPPVVHTVPAAGYRI